MIWPAIQMTVTRDYDADAFAPEIELEDDLGALDREIRRFQARQLKVEHLADPDQRPWVPCQRPGLLDIHFVVTGDGVRIGGASVELTGPSWTASAITDARGEARVTARLDGALFPPTISGGFIVGEVRVSARGMGFLDAPTRHLSVIDCARSRVENNAWRVRWNLLAERGAEIEARSPREPPSDLLHATALLAMLMRQAQRGTISPAWSTALGVSSWIELESRMQALVEVAHGALPSDGGGKVLVGAAPPPSTGALASSGSSGWLIEPSGEQPP